MAGSPNRSLAIFQVAQAPNDYHGCALSPIQKELNPNPLQDTKMGPSDLALCRAASTEAVSSRASTRTYLRLLAF